MSAASPGRGRGSTFSVELPLAVQPALSTEHARPSGAEPGPPASDALLGLSVLAVDDDEDARTLLKLLLEAAGAEVRVAASVADALAELAARAPHIVLSDVGMPSQDGYVLIRSLRGHAEPALRRIPAVAITGLARTQDRIELLRSGFQAQLSKPIEPSELVALVASLCGRPAAASAGIDDAAPHPESRA